MNKIRHSSSGFHIANGDVAPGMWVSKGRGGNGENQLTLDGDNVVHCHRQRVLHHHCHWGWLWWLRKDVVHCWWRPNRASEFSDIRFGRDQHTTGLMEVGS
jgi:hypothetical protein